MTSKAGKADITKGAGSKAHDDKSAIDSLPPLDRYTGTVEQIDR